MINGQPALARLDGRRARADELVPEVRPACQDRTLEGPLDHGVGRGEPDLVAGGDAGGQPRRVGPLEPEVPAADLLREVLAQRNVIAPAGSIDTPVDRVTTRLSGNFDAGYEVNRWSWDVSLRALSRPIGRLSQNWCVTSVPVCSPVVNVLRRSQYLYI